MNDPNMINVHSALLDDDPLNPPTITATQLWALIKERSGVDPPMWQKEAAFHKLDDRRTGTISFARLAAGAALFDPGQSTDPIVSQNNQNMSVSQWIDTSANDILKALQLKLKSKHKTDSNHQLFAHFARACNPATKVDNGDKAFDKNNIQVTYPHFLRGLKQYRVINIKNASSLQAAKKLFSSFDRQQKGYFTSQVFINQGLNDGAQGLGNEVGQYSPAGRQQSIQQDNHKKLIRMKQGAKIQGMGKAYTPSSIIDLLRLKIRSKMKGHSNLEGHRIFKKAAATSGGAEVSNGGRRGQPQAPNVFNISTFVQGCHGLGLTDVPLPILQLVFNALDLDSDGMVDYDEFIHILTLEKIDVPSASTTETIEISAMQNSARISPRSSLPNLVSTRRSIVSTARSAALVTTNPRPSATAFTRWKQMLQLFVAVDKKNSGELGRLLAPVVFFFSSI